MMHFELSDDEPELETLNISNDQYYLPLSDRIVSCTPPKLSHDKSFKIPRYGSETIRHALPAYDLWKAFFPTYIGEARLHRFHRPKLHHFSRGPLSTGRNGTQSQHPIKNLSRHMYRVHMQLKNKVIQAINQRMSREDIESKYLKIKYARELSAKSGELYLFEYCEEFPPVLSQVGMASNIKTYTYGSGPIKNRKKGSNMQNQIDSQSSAGSNIGYNEVIRTERQSKLLYYNAFKPGSKTKFIENNLYRAPIFGHELPSCDFLVIRTRNNYYIRQVNTIFTVGQMMPLTVVPAPNETSIMRFRCDLSNVYIHKLFSASETKPPTLNLDTFMKMFPDYHISIVSRRMKCMGAKVETIDGEHIVQKGTSKYGELSLIDLRNIVRPESYCINMSMLAARQRLRELNYTETMIFPEKGQVVELEAEVLAAPWNTTKAVVGMLNGRAYLDLEKHLVDPTGQAREGFSCITWEKSPTEVEQSKEINDPNRLQSGATVGPITFGKNPLKAKINQEKLRRMAIYQKASQLIADVQSNVLANKENLSSSEGESDVEVDNENVSGSDFSQQLSDLSRLVIGGKTASELSHEKEEEERRQMLADLRHDHLKNQRKPINDDQSDDALITKLKNKYLIITRTYDSDGKQVERSEVVREPRVIALYVKMKGGALTNKVLSKHLGGDGNGTQVGGDQPRRASLGPSELCRTDGTRLVISKKVLDNVRNLRTRSR